MYPSSEENAMSKLIALLATCFALLGSGVACAGNLIDVQIVDKDSGRTLPLYSQRGKTWVAGAPGQRYSIRLVNRTGARVLGVLSVDGVNAITGDTAAASQSGYVLNPYQSTEIAGWRKSNSEVARFYFTPLPDSYAARTDRPENVGVIGVAAFREFEKPVELSRNQLMPEQQARDSARAAAAPAGSAGMLAKPAEERLGTGHGERETSVVSQTSFRRASNSPDQIASIWYDSRERLAALGIIPIPYRPPYFSEPQPFPGHFVPDPGS
jgi:hypothetical protein